MSAKKVVQVVDNGNNVFGISFSAEAEEWTRVGFESTAAFFLNDGDLGKSFGWVHLKGAKAEIGTGTGFVGSKAIAGLSANIVNPSTSRCFGFSMSGASLEGLQDLHQRGLVH